MNLYDITERYASLMDALSEIDDAQAIKDTIEGSGLEGDFNEKCASIGHVMRKLKADSLTVKNEMDRLKKIMQSSDSTYKKLNDYLLDSMIKLDKNQAGTALSMVKVRDNPASVQIVGVVPEEYLQPVKEVERAPDKNKIKAQLKLGELDFAVLTSSKRIEL